MISERKNWTQQQDRILKKLREQREEKKWSVIARIMTSQFNLSERTGKQCRERYHNHLDSKINNEEWTEQQNKSLYLLHVQYGNKWSLISQKLPGRTDNAIKNHFYSTLRKSIRRINRLISTQLKKGYKEIKTQILYKIIEVADSKFKSTSKIDEMTIQSCVSIKNRLLLLDQNNEESTEQQLQNFKTLIQNIQQFISKNKKIIKQNVQSQSQYLHPKSCLSLKKSKSNSSHRSQQDLSSDYSSSVISSYASSQYQSDCSYQDDQYKPKARTRAKSQQDYSDQVGMLNCSSKSCKSNIQSISGLIQNMQISSDQRKTANGTKSVSGDKFSQHKECIQADIQLNLQNTNKLYPFYMSNESQIKLQTTMDMEVNNWNYGNNQVITPISQQPPEKYPFFQDFHFQIQVISPKVSSDSNKSFNDDAFA